VLQEAELSAEADSENNLGGSSETMYFIGLDVHKRTISYCVKDAAGRVYREGKVGSTRRELDSWIRTMPQPRMIAMEATIFTGWIYDHLLPHAEKVKVAHPLMLRAIAAAKKKNDKIDAGKIADCLRCDFLPECHMASTEIRNRRRTLRYRNLVIKHGADEEPRVGPAHGDRSQLQQAAAAQDRLLRRVDVDQRRGEREHPATAEAEPGDDQPLAEARVCAGQLSGARSASQGATTAAQDRARGGVDHGTDVGSGDRRLHTVHFDQASDQLLRSVRR
jgi:Transposase